MNEEKMFDPSEIFEKEKPQEKSLDELIESMPEPLGEYLQAIKGILSPLLAPPSWISLPAVMPFHRTFKVLIRELTPSLEESLTELMNDRWTLSQVHTVGKKVLFILDRLEEIKTEKLKEEKHG